jgi:hemimethylated DNA binding protein
MLLRTLYRQLYRKAFYMDQMFKEESINLLVPRRELRRFSFFIPAHLFDNSDQKLQEKAKGGRMLRDILRQTFEEGPSSRSTATELNNERNDDMFGALRIFNRRISQLQDKNFISKPTRVQYDIGQIFQHKKWGFRGVIIGWYEVCPNGKSWADKYGPFEHGLSQPFYVCLIDRNDRPPEGFVSIAAQENLLAIDSNEPVQHTFVSNLFQPDLVEYGRHVLLDDKMQDHPDN